MLTIEIAQDSGYDGECPASPITVPVKSMLRQNSTGLQVRSPKFGKRTRTTSSSQNTIQSNEAIIR